MGSLVSSAAALLFASLLSLLFGLSSVSGQDLRERDALCTEDGCFMVYFQRKTFLDSWRACKEKGGNLATIKTKQDANTVSTLFSTLDLRYARTKVQVWIGLQRQPRQCASGLPLRGFSWTTGDQDTEYTNWQKEYSLSTCMVPRCVAMGYSLQVQADNFKWLDGACSVPVDGYVCHYAYKAMCPPLWSEGAGNALYTTPFNLLSTLLTHVPFGSVATVPCPGEATAEESVLCMEKEDGMVGWSRDSPLCSSSPVTHSWCEQDNGGCEHFCRPAGDRFFCECGNGYQLARDGRSCELADVCAGDPCESECLPLSGGYRCACPEGYMLAPDEHGCLDVNECLQSPCEQLCVNSLGSFECQCRKGYQLDPKGGCMDVDECAANPCDHACENTLGSYICHCRLGFAPVPEDPDRCQDIDECQIPGTCEQMCVNDEVGGFECYCEEGYELMSDRSSCRRREERDDQGAVTPPFPWATHQPRSDWDHMDYDWNLPKSHTDWEEPSLDWLTDPPSVLNHDIIWVTSAPQEELPIDPGLDPLGSQPEDNQDTTDSQFNWFQWDDDLQSTIYTTTPPPATTTGVSTTPDSYEDDRDATTALPFLSTSTISEGAWNWWAGFATIGQKPGNPEDPVTDHNMPTESIHHSEGGDYLYYTPRDESELGKEDEDYEEITLPQDLTVSTQVPPGGGSTDVVGPGVKEEEEKEEEEDGVKQSSTWLLVGLLVPTCIFLVVMVALGIIYCTHCAVQPRNKDISDCYHWISGAHDKQGAANPSAGVKTPV